MKEQKSFFSFVFPGQGSQTVGMLSELAAEFPEIKETFAAASEFLNYDLWELAQNGPAEKLDQTEFTQPELLTADIAVWRVWQKTCSGMLPSYLAGHSLGEYSALVAAEALQFSDAVRLVAERAQLMQQAFHGKSAMVALVGLADEVVTEICTQASQGSVIVPANYNSIGQTVLSGELMAAERAAELAKKAGAKIVKILPVSVPAHCGLMKPAAELFAERLQTVTINTPKIPVINNVDVAIYSEPNQIRDALVRQLFCPVRWVEIIQLMVTNGINLAVECGPGKVLTGLNKRIDKSLEAKSIGLPESLREIIENVSKKQ